MKSVLCSHSRTLCLRVRKKKLIQTCLDGQVDPLDEELCDFLSTFDCKKVVNTTNIKGILVELAHEEVIQKPQYVENAGKV